MHIYENRLHLTNELHARPYLAIEAPARIVHYAFLTNAEDAELSLKKVSELCIELGVPLPDFKATHYSVRCGTFTLKWEKHTEFCSFTLVASAEPADPFTVNIENLLPQGWLAGLPGQLVVHTRYEILRNPLQTSWSRWNFFKGDSICGSHVYEDAALWTDFQIHSDGATRFLFIVREMGEWEVGRFLQTVLEIETYRTLALMGLPIARQITPEATRLEEHLKHLTQRFAETHHDNDGRDLLKQLTGLAADLSKIANHHAYRFAATQAYAAIVHERIEELDEKVIEGVPTLKQFLDRRFNPSFRTCESVEKRLDRLSERIARGYNLLRARVDVTLEEQNQAILKSMEERSKMQFHLQETVEGLSVVAVSYYALGVLSYFIKGISADWEIASSTIISYGVPLVVLLVWFLTRRVRKKVKG